MSLNFLILPMRLGSIQEKQSSDCERFNAKPPMEAPHTEGMRVPVYTRGLELGQGNPTVITLWHVGKALGVKLRLFFEETTPRRRASGR